MKSFQLMSSRVLVTIICLLSIGSAHAVGQPPKPTAAECDAGLSWTETAMDFGSYVGGAAGVIVMDATTGGLTPGGVVLVGGGFGVPQSFVFTNSVAGCDKKNITITLPASITISNAGSNVIINSLLTSVSPATKFKLTQITEITIGGTLNAGAADAFGSYNGNYFVGFSY